MKRILCYGDSNTWGTVTDGSCKHLPIEKTYPAVLQNLLGSDYYVINAGMPSRTVACDDIKFPKGNRNGALFFAQCLITHEPIDYVVLALGANDMKSKFNRTVEQVVQDLEEKYILFTSKHLAPELSKVPQFIIVCPPVIDETKFDGFEGATQKSMQFERLYKKLASRNNCLYVSNKDMKTAQDGLHLTPESLRLLATEICKLIKQ